MTKNTKKQKTQKTQMSVFVQNSKMKIFSFCVIICEQILANTCQAPQNDHDNLSIVKNKHMRGEKMARKGPTEVIQFHFALVFM